MLTMPCASAGESLGNLDFDRVGWQRAVFHATKFLVSVNSSAELAFQSAADVESELIPVPVEAPIVPAPNNARLTYKASGLGRYSETTLLMHPLTASAIQYESYEPERRRRIYRFMEQGAYVRTWRPVESEEKKTHEEWTDVSEDFRPYKDDPQGSPVIDPIGLLFIIAAADFDAPDDDHEFLALNRNKLSRIVLEAGGLTNIDVDFSVDAGDGSGRRCKGTISALEVRIDVKPYGAETETDFDFMGLQSDVAVFLDPETRLPLLASGKAKIVGKVKIRIQEATLASGQCPKFVG